MTTFGMLLLTLFTVLGSMILGWFLRRYFLGIQFDQAQSGDALTQTKGPAGLAEAGGGQAAADGPAAMRYATGAAQKADGSGVRTRVVTGAIGTVAAGTAAVQFSGEDDDGKSDAHGTADTSGQSDVSAKSDPSVAGSTGSGASARAEAATAGSAASAVARGANFDEADALIGKRSDVSDAHDRHANMDANHLLPGRDDAGSSTAPGAAMSLGTEIEARGAGSADGRGTDSSSGGAVSHTGGNTGEVGSSASSDGTAERAISTHGLSDAQTSVGAGGGIAASSEAASGQLASGADRSSADTSTPAMRGAGSDDASGGQATARSGLAGDVSSRQDADRGSASVSDAAAGRNTGSAGQASAGSSAPATGGAGSDNATGGQTNGRSELTGDARGQRAADSGSSAERADDRSASQAGSSAAKSTGSAFGTDAANTVSDGTKTASATVATGSAIAAAGQATASDTSNEAEQAKHDELEASRAEVRQLRGRLDLKPEEGVAGDTSRSIDARLAASREDARALRQQLWSQQAAADAAAKADAPDEAADFGTLNAQEAEAQSLLSSGAVPSSLSASLEAPTPGFDPDDLTKINGIGKPTQGRLNRSGIYYYDQIAKFSAGDIAWVDNEMTLDGRVVSDRWIPQAQRLAGAGSAVASGSGSAKATTSSTGALKGPAPTSLLYKPIAGRKPDDLTAISGVGPKLQDQLNDHGIFYYSQIAEFTAADQAWASETLGFPGRVERDNWIPQARELIANPPSVEAEGRAARLGVLAAAGKELGSLEDDAPGEMSSDETEAMKLIESGEFVADENNRPSLLLSSASDGAQDDLKRIKGVGPKLEDLLNSLGVYYFRQVAAFSATDIAWVDSKLRFRGRIVRDRWVDQAKRLG